MVREQQYLLLVDFYVFFLYHNNFEPTSMFKRNIGVFVRHCELLLQT
jgi:hypothetical protein